MDVIFNKDTGGRPAGFGTTGGPKTKGYGCGFGQGSDRQFGPSSEPIMVESRKTVPASEKKNYTILIVDRESMTRELTKCSLESSGHAIGEADSIDAAAGVLSNLKPHVIIVDAETAGFDYSGCETALAGALRRFKEAAPDAKIIVVDTDYNASRADKIIRCGADRAMDKTRQSDELAPALDDLMPVVFEEGAKAKEPPMAMLTEGTTTVKKHGSILVVDDERSVRKLLENCLENDYAISTAEDGEAGLAAYRKAYEEGCAPDLVISDWGMPVMAGPAMIKAIKAINPEAKFIYVSAYEKEGDIGVLKETGPIAIVEKTSPFDFAALNAAVEKAFQK